MTDSSKMSLAQEVAEAAKAAKQDWKRNKVRHAGRFVVNKDKVSESSDSISSVKILTDVASDIRYTITLTASVEPVTPPKEGEDYPDFEDVDFDDLQDRFKAFLKTIHESI